MRNKVLNYKFVSKITIESANEKLKTLLCFLIDGDFEQIFSSKAGIAYQRIEIDNNKPYPYVVIQ